MIDRKWERPRTPPMSEVRQQFEEQVRSALLVILCVVLGVGTLLLSYWIGR